MMNCSECSCLLYDYLDNELDMELRNRVENHFAGCAACRHELREIREVLAQYHTQITAVTPAPDFARQVIAKLADNKPQVVIPAPLAVLGGLLLVLSCTGLLILLPLLYPVLRVFSLLIIHLLTLPAIILTAFPIIQVTSLSLLLVALVMTAWATRRATLY